MTVLDFARLFAAFRAASWAGWRAILARVTPAVRELYLIVGRGAGKSRMAALIACAFASREYAVAPGESIYIGLFGPDKKQAALTFKYVVGLIKSVPTLAALIVSESKDSIELSNGIIIETITASVAAPRGRGYALIVIEEAAFLPTDASANPDVELLRAVRPALARVPGSLLVVVSSPYARRGVLYAAWQKYHGKPDGDVVLVQASTLELNPTFDARAIEKAYEDDPASAAAEYGAQFRSDVEGFVSRDAIEVCIVRGRLELPPLPAVVYAAFVDPSGGSQDSFTLAVAHRELRDAQAVVVLDAVREVRPPFSPERVVDEFAALLRSYRIASVSGDRYAGEWPREQFLKHGVTYLPSAKAKSDLYRDSLPALNSARVELLDHPRLLTQLAGLERRTARGGRDSIDHAPGGRDDVINSACGVIDLLLTGTTAAVAGVWGAARSSQPTPPQAQREIVGQQFRCGKWEPLYRDETKPIPAHATVQRR